MKMRNKLKKIKPYIINHYTIFFLFMIGYSELIKQFGGISLRLSAVMECLLILYLYFYFNLITKKNKLTPFITAIPIIIAYTLYDLYFIAYGKVFKVIEFTELPELIDILPFSYIALFFLFFVTPLIFFLYFINVKKTHYILIGILPIFLLILSTEVIPDTFIDTFKIINKHAEKRMAQVNGRLFMLLHYEAQRNSINKKIKNYRNREKYEDYIFKLAQSIKKNSNNRNIHLIALESFFDPTLFKGLKLSKNPIHPKYTALFGDKLSFSISPVFGGATSQAEFELLCGVPAFSKLSGIDFNVFTGAEAFCLPGILNKLGYRTFATKAYKPDYFNAMRAYKGMGFDKQFFPIQHFPGSDTYLTKYRDNMIFDGDLFSENIKFISEQLELHTPIFNYILTVYGHTPYIIDEKKRPLVIEILSDNSNKLIERAVNQIYYRTEAIADFVKKLTEIDPKSIIILVSDHLPSLSGGKNTYKKLKYMNNIEDSIHYNRLLVIENGKPVNYGVIHHFNIQDMILNYITDSKYCSENERCLSNGANIDKSKYYERYMQIMAHASEYNTSKKVERE